MALPLTNLPGRKFHYASTVKTVRVTKLDHTTSTDRKRSAPNRQKLNHKSQPGGGAGDQKVVKIG